MAYLSPVLGGSLTATASSGSTGAAVLRISAAVSTTGSASTSAEADLDLIGGTASYTLAATSSAVSAGSGELTRFVPVVLTLTGLASSTSSGSGAIVGRPAPQTPASLTDVKLQSDKLRRRVRGTFRRRL
jgi:hypothetical protein